MSIDIVPFSAMVIFALNRIPLQSAAFASAGDDDDDDFIPAAIFANFGRRYRRVCGGLPSRRAGSLLLLLPFRSLNSHSNYFGLLCSACSLSLLTPCQSNSTENHSLRSCRDHLLSANLLDI